MPTICELEADFDDNIIDLYDMLLQNINHAGRWGTRWHLIREEALTTPHGAPVRQMWGFSSAYARTDGLGGYVSFLVELTANGRGQTDVSVVVSSPYESKKRRGPSDYFKRNHQVALRLLEFCVAPYEEIHPPVGRVKRWAQNLFNRHKPSIAS